MALAAEAEYGTIFVNAPIAVHIRTAPAEMGWKQVPTAIQVDNSTAVGIATNELLQKKSKAMGKRLCWINDRIEQGQVRVFWRPGPETRGNCHSNIIHLEIT